MSKGRMEDLLSALSNEGWRLLDQQEHPNGTSNLFKLEDDIVGWGIARADSSVVVELEFHAFGDLGQRTNQLRDILYCVALGTGDKLYFDKRESAEWRENLSKFVHNLTNAQR